MPSAEGTIVDQLLKLVLEDDAKPDFTIRRKYGKVSLFIEINESKKCATPAAKARKPAKIWPQRHQRWMVKQHGWRNKSVPKRRIVNGKPSTPVPGDMDPGST